ncbi:MAG: pallilysin-related adhesin [Treponema sp.]|nr:pallilysin-related adhesin [Treponema sp.]
MRKGTLITIVGFLVCVAVLGYYALRKPAPEGRSSGRSGLRVLVPALGASGGSGGTVRHSDQSGSGYVLKGQIGQGELVVAVLDFDFSGNGIDDQVVAFQYGGTGNVHIALFSYDPLRNGHARLWEAKTAATLGGTVSMHVLDILGDRSDAIVVTGMNGSGEQTLGIFRRNPEEGPERPFPLIADIRIDGTVSVQETPRSAAYNQGIAPASPFVILASGPDPESDNLLDRLDLTYTYDHNVGSFEETDRRHVAGAQIEQGRILRVLSGDAGVFEDFIGDLWYRVSEQGTVDSGQFVFFDPRKKEIVFFGDESRQVFMWQQSNTTRQGIFIATSNSTITTLRRNISVSLESMDSIRVSVNDIRRFRFDIAHNWNGTYRRAGSVPDAAPDRHAL